jgi:hypothetical protein
LRKPLLLINQIENEFNMLPNLHKSFAQARCFAFL